MVSLITSEPNLQGLMSIRLDVRLMFFVFFNLIFYFLFESPAATLSIHPDKSQFFRYEHISLSCAVPVNSTGWTLRRNTSYKTSQPCKGGFGDPRDSVCTIRNVHPFDSGVYWCESEQGECSKPVNITVAGMLIFSFTLCFMFQQTDENQIKSNHRLVTYIWGPGRSHGEARTNKTVMSPVSHLLSLADWTLLTAGWTHHWLCAASDFFSRKVATDTQCASWLS